MWLCVLEQLALMAYSAEVPTFLARYTCQASHIISPSPSLGLSSPPFPSPLPSHPLSHSASPLLFSRNTQSQRESRPHLREAPATDPPEELEVAQPHQAGVRGIGTQLL